MHLFDQLVDTTETLEIAETGQEILRALDGVKESFENVLRFLRLCEEDLIHTEEKKGGEQWRSELFICAVCLSGTEGDRSRIVAAKFKWLLGNTELQLATLRRAA